MSRMKKGPPIKGHWVTHFDYWTGEERAHCSCGEIFSPRDGLTGDERFQRHKENTLKAGTNEQHDIWTDAGVE